MKFILFVVLFACSLVSFGQKTKTIEIVKRLNYQEYVDAICHLNNENKVEIDNITIRFACQNSEYQQITETITLFSGTAKEFYIYITNIENYYHENVEDISDGVEVSGNVNEQKISLRKISFVRYIDVYTEKGYHSFTIKWIQKIKSQFVDWCKKNNVAYE